MLFNQNIKSEAESLVKKQKEVKCLLLGLKHDLENMENIHYLDQKYLLGRLEDVFNRSDNTEINVM